MSAGTRYERVLVVLLAVGVFLFYFVAQGTDALVLFANYGLILFAAAAGTLGLLSYARLRGSMPGVLSLGFGLGQLFWMLGLVVYTYGYLVAGTGLSYLSLADVFYFLSYPPMFFGCVGLLRLFSSSLDKANWMGVAIAGLLLSVLSLVYAIVPSIEYLGDPLEALVTMLYPLLDTVVLLLILPLLFVFWRGILKTPYALLVAGTTLIALGDLAFTYVNLAVGYYDGHPVDLLWFMACIAYGYGFWRLHAGFDI